jgi:hypothetical protein
MGDPAKPRPVTLFVRMLSGEISLLDALQARLRERFGPLLHRSEDLPWNYTDYYAEELGQAIVRRFLFFRNRIQPDEIAGIKRATNEIERDYVRAKGERMLRRINLDPGYLDAARVVLATTKDYSHRIYLGGGICAEVTLIYVQGSYRPQAHAYPDYRTPETLALFNRVRSEIAGRGDGRAAKKVK